MYVKICVTSLYLKKIIFYIFPTFWFDIFPNLHIAQTIKDSGLIIFNELALKMGYEHTGQPYTSILSFFLLGGGGVERPQTIRGFKPHSL